MARKESVTKNMILETAVQLAKEERHRECNCQKTGKQNWMLYSAYFQSLCQYDRVIYRSLSESDRFICRLL